ncbi:MAG: hypothetical protein JWQ23_3608 [Herminiimonas sp.]|nr:hypothetical protein [Herminiimonas sp.]
MKAMSTVAKTAADISTRFANLRENSGFLRKNLHLLAIWPLGALFLIAVGWSGLFVHLKNERLQAELHALEQASALARGYAGHLERTIRSMDQILLHVRYEWLLSKGSLRLETIRESGLFPVASLGNIAIMDRNGTLVTSAIPDVKKVNVSSTSYFTAQENSAGDALFIGPSFYSSISGRNIIPISRKLSAPGGSFDGIVVLGMVPDYFTADYDETTLGKAGLQAVAGADNGIWVSRIGSTVYQSQAPALTALPFFESASGSKLLDGNEWFIDKRTRYLGWAQLGGYQAYALTGLDQEQALAPYQARRDTSINSAIWATIALMVFTLIAMALSLRLAWRKNQLDLTHATYRLATEEGLEGFYIARPVRDRDATAVDFEVVDANHRGAEFFRERREELIGARVSTLYAGANPERLLEWLSQAMEKGFFEGDVEIPGNSPLTIRWAHLRIVRSDDNLAITLTDITASKAHVEELERRSNEDELTRLPNRHWARAYLPRAVRHAEEQHSMLGILYVDLDGFKKINDTMGHAVGDEVLRNTARRLRDAVRPHDHVVRLGGDEFIIIIEQIEQSQDAAHVAERVVHAFREGFRLINGVHTLGASIGISIFPVDGRDAETLLQKADIAMYSVKTSGKGAYRFYDQKFYDALRARLAQESDLRQAIAQDQFIMYYQPRVDLETGAVSSMEALVRWQHPVRGLIAPLEFIPLAEESGLILGLGEMVIEKVCMQLAQWGQRSEQLLPVSVNVSSRQFNETDVAAILTQALARHNVEPRLIEVELTESLMMGGEAEVTSALTAIRRMGMTLLVDDFGTGYSSLSQLQRLEFDVLKVDRAFTEEIDRTEQGKVFFTAIITMAHALGMRVVAEGVENERQILILKSLHCDEIQGYYISRPFPPSEMQAVHRPELPKV